jgi:quercetin dioxygenase-like cupin family protein
MVAVHVVNILVEPTKASPPEFQCQCSVRVGFVMDTIVRSPKCKMAQIVKIHFLIFLIIFMNNMKHVFKLIDGRQEPIKDLFNSERIVIVDKDTAGAEDVTFAYCKFEAKTSKHKKHIHPFAEEIIYILSGKGVSGLADTEIEMSAGQTMFVPRNAVHWFYNPFDITGGFQ